MLSRIDIPLIFSGHSLGGALAVLAASICPKVVVYTFGTPKIWDAAFACSLEYTRIYRVENKYDLIPTMPPAAKTFDFRHVGIPICLKDDLLSGLRSRSTRGWLDPPEFLSDHAPVNYTIRLENMITRNSDHLPANHWQEIKRDVKELPSDACNEAAGN